MKKLFAFVMFMIVMSLTVTAQLATYSVAKTQVTVDKTWEDLPVESAEDMNILVIYDFEKDQFKITNKDQSMFFVIASENQDDYTDKDGDILKEVKMNAYDEEGNFVNLSYSWWDNPDIVFSAGTNTLLIVYNDDYWVKYYMNIEMYRDE